jgi:hypothetical protein
MERDFAGHKCWLSIISTKRAHNVERMQEQVGPATWYVTFRDFHDYRKAGTARTVAIHPGVARARNEALKDAFYEDLTCVQLSDDLRSCWFVDSKGDAQKIPATEAIENLLDHLDVSQFFLAGFPPTANKFFASSKETYDTFIVGDFIAVKPNHLQFDEKLKLKEDYGYSAAHIQIFGGTLRLNWVLADFEHRNNAGGAVDLRTREIERESMKRLMDTYPGWFRLNKKRSGTEVIMRVPRQRLEL